MNRELVWEGCANVRDLGGIPLEQGGETRYGVVVRADNVRYLSDTGWRALAEHGVTRIVDLRLPVELTADPPRDIGVEVVHVSLMGDEDPNFHDHIEEHSGPESYWTWVYVWALENRRESIGRALAAIADADGVVLFHCAGGKDRTGIIAALTLRAAGASIDEIVRDYHLSSGRLSASTRAWLEAAEDAQEQARRELLIGTPPEAMRRALEHLDRELGGVEAYLRAAGLSDEQLGRLRSRLAA
ncbi:MAG TPA: tyrosine-protein phosphatase [Gaiellaceae bacterium]|nr:tyrosine-protein phosphatase [Gaiellaceae bacterium]